VKLLSVFVWIFLIQGCAHVPAGKGENPQTLLSDACGIGQGIRSMTGSIWMNLNSKEAKGGFPASVSATAPDNVTLEVTNLLGGREALIQVSRGNYSVEVPGKDGRPPRKTGGSGSWGGIPLRWASELFLGRVPCPTPGPALQLRVGDSGDLVAEANGERFVYHFHRWAGKAWPESLHWENLAQPDSAVDFKFDTPEDKSGVPKKWEAKSARGEVKMHWRDLQIQM
jgi:hypothetical protein